jgi:hypothetical protein
MSVPTDHSLVLEPRTSACPVQYEGTVGPYAFYFRARGDLWEFCVADTVEQAVNALLWPEETPYHYQAEGYYGERGGFEAGWMPLEEAEQIIREHAARFVEQQSGQ